MPLSAELELNKKLAEFYDDPLGYVMFCFPWTTEESIQKVRLPEKYRERFPNCEWGPDEWACEFLDDLGAEIKKRGFDGKNATKPIRFSTASGHGIGKTVLVAWLIKFIMDTRPYCKGTVTAGTDIQLRTKTWAELGKWHRMSLTRHRFNYSSGRGSMSLKHPTHGDGWAVNAQTCREENSEAFAGQHAAGSTSFYIFDEASVVPDKIYEVRDGGLTDGEPMIFDFGNPTRNTGKFFENCEGSAKHRYIVRHIDSRDVAITSKDDIREKLEDYGEDSDYFRVRVRGVFPKASNVQFIASDLVRDAMSRDIFVDRNAPLVIGVDVARFGDDETVLYPRRGLDCRSFEPKCYMGLDTTQVCGKVIEMIRFFKDVGQEVAALFIDGSGMGAGVVDQLRHLGYNPVDVVSGTKANNPMTYRLRSDELWGNLRDALRREMALPHITSDIGKKLYEQLTQREYGYTLMGSRIQLESKKDMRKRGLPSPDLADALALSFAQEVAPRNMDTSFGAYSKPVIIDYDPLEDI